MGKTTKMLTNFESLPYMDARVNDVLVASTI